MPTLLIRGDGTTEGTLYNSALESAVCRDALALIGQERSELRAYTLGGAEQGPTPIVESDERPHGAGVPAYVATTTTAGEAHVFIDAHPAPADARHLRRRAYRHPAGEVRGARPVFGYG